MRQQKPEVIKAIEALLARAQNEKWKADKLCYGNARAVERRRRNAEEHLRRIERIDQWVRAHMTEEEWKGLLG